MFIAAWVTHGGAVARNLHRHHWEDFRFFRHTRAQIHSVADCFTQPSAWPGLYRPLSTNCYYLAAGSLWGNRVAPYHLVNAAAFVVNGVLLFVIVRRLLPAPLALLVPALWASRVALRQVLLYTSEFQALCSTFFSLLALALALPPRLREEPDAGSGWWREAAALAAFAAALLSKESTVVLPVVVSAASWLFGWRRWRRDLAWWGLAAAWAVLFALMLRGVSGHEPTGYTYDLSPRIGTRYAAYALMVSNAIVVPVDNWTLPARIPALARRPAVLAALALAAAALAALLVGARRLDPRRRADPVRALVLGFVWFVAGMAPFVVFADRLFLRYVYFGSAGLALLVLAVPAVAAEALRLREVRREATRVATAPMSAPARP